MANLVDLMVGSIRLGLVSERGGGSFSFEVIYSHKSTEAVGQTGSISSIESITRLAYYNQHYSLQSVLKPITVNASIYSAYSQRIDLQRLQLHSSLHLIPTIESLNLIPTIYRSTACITIGSAAYVAFERLPLSRWTTKEELLL